MIKYRVEVDDGSTFWYKYGTNKLHREDGPARKYANGDKEWFLNGEWHREDGPAIERTDGDKAWWLNGKRHRKDGPADIRYKSGTKIVNVEFWFLNGEPHREDGPADIYYKNGKVLEEEKEWHLNGSELFKKDFTTIEMINSMKAWSLFTPVELIRLKNQ